MNVSFSGLKNATCTYIVNAEPYRTTKNGIPFFVPKSKDIVVNVQLDNNGETDLDNFKKILKEYPSNTGKDCISLTYEEKSLIDGSKRGLYYINGNELKLCDKNLSLFSQLSKLMEKMQDKTSFSQEKNYPQCLDFQKALYSIVSKFAKYMDNINLNQVKDYAIDPKRITNSATQMHKQIQKDMIDYFSI